MDLWSEFGGLAGQLNRLIIVLRLAVTENVTLSHIYDQELKQRAKRLDRVRGEEAYSTKLFSQENDEIERNKKLSGVRLSRRRIPYQKKNGT